MFCFCPCPPPRSSCAPTGPEPVIVQIKESLRTSDDLDNRLNELAAVRNQNRLSVVKWWAGSKLLVMVSFPSNFTERQATAAIAKLQQLPAVEKVVAVSAFNLHFRSGDFTRSYGANDAIPDVARRGFDAERIGKSPSAAPDQLALLQVPHVPNRLIVGWKEEHIWKADTTGFSKRMVDFHRNAGCRVVREFRYSPTKLAQVLEFDDPNTLADKIRRYVESGFVVYAQPDFIYKTTAMPNDPSYGSQWSLPIIKADQAWDMTTGDPSVIIAVADSGARVNGPPFFMGETPHPDFVTNLWSGQNDGAIHNFIYNTQSVDDDLVTPRVRYHGSKAAAIIGAQGNNGLYLTGIAWDTSLMILKVVASDDSSRTSAVADAIMYAANNGATAINLSVGFRNAVCTRDLEQTNRYTCTEGSYDEALVAALKYARNNNMVTVSAAGNGAALGDLLPDNTHPIDNDFNINRISPASIPTDNNISVLATNRSDNEASYSSHGKYRVDLGAPGGESQDPIPGLIQTYTVPPSSSDVEGFHGTSAAAPHVTGAAALIKSKFPWENYLGIRDRILMGTDRTGTLEGLCRTNGRLNAYKALQTRSMFRNFSTRARVEGGDRVMSAGFVIGGSSSGSALKVGIRGLGPSVGVSVPKLGNPRIELYDAASNLIDANNNWYEDWNAPDTVASGLQPSDNNEAALVRWLNPGSYTVIVRDEGTQYGVGLFEIYELQNNTNEQSRLVNLSTRCVVGNGDEVAIAGTTIGNLNPPDPNNPENPPRPDRRVLILGKGPSLAAYGLQGTLSDPQLQVAGGDYNNDWRTIDDDSGDHDALEEELGPLYSGFAPAVSTESVLWPTFRPGGYTVILSGANGSTGIGLVEFYEY